MTPALHFGVIHERNSLQVFSENSLAKERSGTDGTAWPFFGLSRGLTSIPRIPPSLLKKCLKDLSSVKVLHFCTLVTCVRMPQEHREYFVRKVPNQGAWPKKSESKRDRGKV
jgi:hypothetical protein